MQRHPQRISDAAAASSGSDPQVMQYMRKKK
jgi:hypothetical protein